MDVVLEKINEAKNDTERIAAVEEFLLSRLNQKAADDLVALAVNLIRQHGGNIKMTALAETLNISQSQFEKRFRKIVGSSPKKFASLVRLSSVTKAKPEKNGLINLGIDSGYFDQAHFIKDFKSFTGQTPEQFFSKR
jgi:methylphosphotriester-DNA--protein-cysteine methyltransferase